MICAAFDVDDLQALSLLPYLGDEIIAHVTKINHPKRKAQSALAWALAVYAAGGRFSVSFCDNGAPCMADGRFVSVSHTLAGAAAVVDASPCAVDIETIKRPYPAPVVSRFFGAQTAAKIAAALDPDRMFCTLWTFRECSEKCDCSSVQFDTFDQKNSVLTVCTVGGGAKLKTISFAELRLFVATL